MNGANDFEPPCGKDCDQWKRVRIRRLRLVELLLDKAKTIAAGLVMKKDDLKITTPQKKETQP